MKLLLHTIAILGSCLISSDSPRWLPLPDLPDPLGVAGPVVGVASDALIVAGGANFPPPVWQNDKEWHDAVFVLSGKPDSLRWNEAGVLPRKIAYAASVTVDDGILVIGGNNADETFASVYLLQYDAGTSKVQVKDFPPLPQPCAYAAAARIGKVVYVAGGQSGASLETAMDNFWSLDLSKRQQPDQFRWKVHSNVPFASRAFASAAAQHDGSAMAFYLISGRRQNGDEVQFLNDLWKYRPDTNQWIRAADGPAPMVAGTAIDSGSRSLLVLSGSNGSLFHLADTLKDRHPGFTRKAYRYDTVDNRWAETGEIPQNQVTTTAVRWRGEIILPSGEIRPRVRTKKVWRIVESED